MVGNRGLLRAVALSVLGLVLVPAPRAVGHNGEYRPPLPPPIREDDPPPEKRRPGVTREGGGTPTLPPEGANPPPPSPGEIPLPPGPLPGAARDDHRLTVVMWWEANRHRLLPPPPALPRREDLVAALLATLERESDTVRERALLALGKAGAVEALPRMVAAAKARTPSIGASAILALGLLGDEAGPLLADLLVSAAGARRRSFTALAVGLAGDPGAGLLLRGVLAEDRDANVRSAAALGAGLLADGEAANHLSRMVLGVHPLDTRVAAGSRKAAIATRCAAARALGESPTPEAYRHLVWALENAESEVRAAAAIQLARAPGTAGVPSLRLALAAGSPLAVREYTLLGLAERGDEHALAEAARILASRSEADVPLRPFAALALGLSRDRRFSGTLLDVVRKRGAPPDTRAAAALALGLVGDRKAAPALERVLATEKQPLVVGWGLLGDALLGGPRAAILAKKALERWDVPGPRRDAVTALGLVAAKDSADLLVEKLQDSYHVNREAAVALARVDAGRAARELLARLSDPNIYAGRFAAHSLGVLLDRRSPGALADLAAHANLLALTSVQKAVVYLENEYLYELIRGL